MDLSADQAAPGMPPALRFTIDEACTRARAMAAQAMPLHQALTCLVAADEELSGETASILVLDRDGLLRNGASPNLPRDYLDAIDRLKPAPDLGTCAAAAATGEIVLTPDFESDGKWAELKHLPLSIGYRGAWSMPIKDSRGRVLGTFGTYYPDRRSPDAREMRAVARLVALAATEPERAF